MIAHLIRWSVANRFLVLLATLMVSAWGVWSVYRTPLDAIPDLSDVQVIIRTAYPGQAPQIVETVAAVVGHAVGPSCRADLRRRRGRLRPPRL